MGRARPMVVSASSRTADRVRSQTIVVAGALADVSISLLSGTIIVAQQDFHPHYESNQPNGPGCDPICRQASETWTVP